MVFRGAFPVRWKTLGSFPNFSDVLEQSASDYSQCEPEGTKKPDS